MVQRPHTNQRVCNESVSLGLLASSPLLSVLARSGSFLYRDLGPWLQFVLKQSDPEQATSHLQACMPSLTNELVRHCELSGHTELR